MYCPAFVKSTCNLSSLTPGQKQKIIYLLSNFSIPEVTKLTLTVFLKALTEHFFFVIL